MDIDGSVHCIMWFPSNSEADIMVENILHDVLNVLIDICARYTRWKLQITFETYFLCYLIQTENGTKLKCCQM